ncbi:hypothetical protein F2Q69_00024487 [Brassica cretica]|uniref:Uncharacterized protein n=1 Tax=Brassica cretica TaxID=69181 RepID=A0A8S9QT72_BRACR|nr:hypothetical protein F2Q69_00024487 [Brassica cretica]
MGTLPDLSAIIAAQLGLTSGEGPSMTVPRAGEVFPTGARSAGKGKKRKRGDGSGVERSTEETSDVPPSGVPGRGARVDGDNVPVLVLSNTSGEGRDSQPPKESRWGGEENTGEVSEDPAVQVSPIARESSVRASELSALNDRESDREA